MTEVAEVTDSKLTSKEVKYMLVPHFCSETGYTPKAVYHKIAREQWAEGQVFLRAPDNRIHIIWSGYLRWVGVSK